MHTLRSAFAAAILSCTLAGSAAAMPAEHLSAQGTSSVQKVVLVCGPFRCWYSVPRLPYWGVRRAYWGYPGYWGVRRAYWGYPGYWGVRRAYWGYPGYWGVRRAFWGRPGYWGVRGAYWGRRW